MLVPPGPLVVDVEDEEKEGKDGRPGAGGLHHSPSIVMIYNQVTPVTSNRKHDWQRLAACSKKERTCVAANILRRQVDSSPIS